MKMKFKCLGDGDVVRSSSCKFIGWSASARHDSDTFDCKRLTSSFFIDYRVGKF